MTRMDVLSDKEINTLVSSSKLVRLYDKTIDSESAYEILKEKIEESQKEGHQDKLKDELKKAKRGKSRDSLVEQMSKNTMVRQVGRTLVREITRGLLGALGVSSTRRR